jgi:hypothetical protein
MAKPDFKNEPWRWNRWYASEYDSEAVNIADDFYTLDKTCDYALLSAQYMVKNKNGKSPDPCFTPTEILAASKKPDFQVDPCARVIDACWQSYKRWKMNDSVIVVMPPPAEPPKTLPKPDPWAAHPNSPSKPVPTPKTDKLPEIHLPQEKKPRPEWVVKASVWLTVLTPVSLVILYFVPPPFNMIAKAVFEAIKLLIGG